MVFFNLILILYLFVALFWISSLGSLGSNPIDGESGSLRGNSGMADCAKNHSSLS